MRASFATWETVIEHLSKLIIAKKNRATTVTWAETCEIRTIKTKEIEAICKAAGGVLINFSIVFNWFN